MRLAALRVREEAQGHSVRCVTQAQGRYAIQPLGIGDGTTASAMVSGVALALRHRLLTHEGMLVDAALLRVGMWCMVRARAPTPTYARWGR
jgi:crotonobetainyl-CoA:carnitine CoA-transferase CaiB-like acyl-CoA transferase